MYKKLKVYIFILPFSIFFLPRLNVSCATPTMPSGGPEDTIPPQIIKTYPKQKSCFFKGKKIRIVFDKEIEVNDLNNQLLISPNLKSKPGKKKWIEKIKNKEVIIKLISDLEPNTTYTFYFREGIRNITEKNVAKNPTLVFSTGESIDTLSVSGEVEYLMTEKKVNNGLVFLYRAEDTLDIFNSAPDYFTNTDEEGNFRIDNIKEGKYKIYASEKIKGNQLIVDASKTAYGFLPNVLNLSQNITGVKLNILKLDVNDFILKSSRPQGRYFEISFNKEVIEYTLSLLQKPKKFQEMPVLYNNLLKERKEIRVYNTLKLLEEDSIQAKIYAKDTLGNVLEDTIMIHFREDVRAKESLSTEFKAEEEAKIDVEQPVVKGKIIFNKPITSINAENVYLALNKEDTISLTNEDFTFSPQKDTIYLNKPLDKGVIEHIYNMQDIKKEPLQAFKLYIDKNTFVSVDKDHNEIIEFFYKLKNKKELGKIGGKVMTDAPGFIVQLLNRRYQVVKEIRNRSPYQFIDIEPGRYLLRLLILENKDGEWNPGNIKINKMPSPVIFYEKTPEEGIVVRSNWENNDYNFEFFLKK